MTNEIVKHIFSQRKNIKKKNMTGYDVSKILKKIIYKFIEDYYGALHI